MSARTVADIAAETPGSLGDALTCLHRVAVAHGCSHRVDSEEGQQHYTITYSAAGLVIRVEKDRLRITCEYDLRAFLGLYRSTKDETTKRFMFSAAIPCSYCITDKCTTLLMGDSRTIQYNGETKKLCGPYRHTLDLHGIDERNVASVVPIVHMVFEYVTPGMHRDLFLENNVTVTTRHVPAFAIVGFKHQQNMLSPTTETFIAKCLRRDAEGRRPVDRLLDICGSEHSERFVGVTTNFVNGGCYDFILGVGCSVAPDALPEGIVKVAVDSGDYAVYNSSAADYKSVWQDFTIRYYDMEAKGYDSHRLPFEYYDEEGRFSDVHIPVSVDMPRESGWWVRPHFTPDIKVAGVVSCSENDHPLYKGPEHEAFRERALDLFPMHDRIVDGFVHAQLGQPMLCVRGVEIDVLGSIPDGLEEYVFRGGYWQVEGCRHFNGGSCGWALQTPYETRVPLEPLAHPRAFIEYTYRCRGGYVETATPVRVLGDRRIEVVERAPCLVLGRLEAPPDSVVTRIELGRMCDMDCNPHRGTLVFAFTYRQEGNGPYGNWFYDQPVIKGFAVDDTVEVPDSLELFKVEGGTYLKLTESIPNGEYDWGIPAYIHTKMQAETGRALDTSRRIIVCQKDYGKEFETFVPVL